ncbi:type I restriction-modification system subunit M [Sediminicoccus rosea]|uniref:site-specific DNA-methyltransferase (adenine-specific) n=1 Tax=Sediminicoccus rosea TaxID=1225128 RepID=A0ABZ0PC99_9PROT|nr:class I SAM-dependent DNA methyltransferase [Sediminicoccus rosea]WPB83107.1 class I SAM-dependent DNA methyltransferase [Sediminicoccus rosea]
MNINGFIWSIADDVLHHVYDRTKYRDIILPMTVIRRLDAVLEPTRAAVLARKAELDAAGVPEAAQGPALDRAAGQAFHNRSPFTLRQLLARPNPETQKADFEAYLDGFSENVREVLARFKFREELGRLAEHNRLHALIEKFCDERINLAPTPVRDDQGRVRLPGLDNHTMGTIFEELLRRFNEDYNQGAGEQFTPRDIVEMMAELVFRPAKDRIGDGTYLLYDDACGTGGMLTVGEAKLRELARKEGKKTEIHLYGQELNPETYAICKADLLLKGEGEEARNIAFGSTLSADVHGRNGLKFDFMMANPPFGTTWKIDLADMGGKAAANDPRFVVEHEGLANEDDRLRLLPRVSDGQLLFLVNKLSKMKDTPLGSRIADVHNGSALFTGEAGSGESNVRRWIIENDWLEAIVALPLNIFYNTGIATYVWVLSNRKAEARKGKVQLIDATKWFRPLRRNLGKRNCEMTAEHIQAVLDAYETMETSDTSIVLPNSSFGYWKIVVERPLRLRSRFTREAVDALRFQSGHRALREALHAEFGDALFDDFASVAERLKAHLDPPEPEGEEAAEGEEEASADGEDAAAETEDATPKLPRKTIKKLLDAGTWARDRRLHRAAERLMALIGQAEHDDFAAFEAKLAAVIKAEKLALKPAEARLIARAMSWRAADAKPIVKSVSKKAADPHGGLFAVTMKGKPAVVAYEPDKALSDTEIVAFDEAGGIEAFFKREVLPHAADAWIDRDKTKIGYEISFARHFYKPKPPRPLAEIKAEIDALERQTQALLDVVLVEAEA